MHVLSLSYKQIKKIKSSSKTKKAPTTYKQKPLFKSEHLTRKKKSCSWAFNKNQLQLWDWNIPKLPLYSNLYLLMFVDAFPLITSNNYYSAWKILSWHFCPHHIQEKNGQCTYNKWSEENKKWP